MEKSEMLLWAGLGAGALYVLFKPPSDEHDGDMSGYSIVLPDRGVSDRKRDRFGAMMREAGADTVSAGGTFLDAYFRGMSKSEATRLVGRARKAGFNVRMARWTPDGHVVKRHRRRT